METLSDLILGAVFLLVTVVMLSFGIPDFSKGSKWDLCTAAVPEAPIFESFWNEFTAAVRGPC